MEEDKYCPVCEKRADWVIEHKSKNVMLVNNEDRDGVSQVNEFTISANVSETHIRNNAYTGGVDLYFHE